MTGRVNTTLAPKRRCSSSSLRIFKNRTGLGAIFGFRQGRDLQGAPWPRAVRQLRRGPLPFPALVKEEEPPPRFQALVAFSGGLRFGHASTWAVAAQVETLSLKARGVLCVSPKTWENQINGKLANENGNLAYAWITTNMRVVYTSLHRSSFHYVFRLICHFILHYCGHIYMSICTL